MNPHAQSRCTSSLFVLAALALGACAEESQQRVATSGPPSQPIANEPAVAQIADARCEREAQCHSIGGGTDSDKATCSSRLRPVLSKSMSDWGCGESVDKERLDRCLGALQDEQCETGMKSSVVALHGCQPADLCGSR